MKYFWMRIFMIWLKTGMIVASNCRNSTCQLIPGFDAKLFCKSLFKDKILGSVNCSWLPYNPSSGTLCAEYTLHLAWKNSVLRRSAMESCKKFQTKVPFYDIPLRSLHRRNTAIIWVSCDMSNATCMKTREFFISPWEKCEEPKMVTAVHSPRALRFKLDTFGEVRYREKNTDLWHTVEANKEEKNINISESMKNSSFVVQKRCKNEACFHCDWGVESTIHRELTEAPTMTVTSKALPKGRQSVSVEWKYQQIEDVTYVLKITRLPDSCFHTLLLYELTNTTFHINLSLAFYKITIYAKNKASSSPNASAMVPQLSTPEFDGKLFATIQNNGILLTWSPHFKCTFFIINWGTNSSNMETKSYMEEMENVTLTGYFEKMKKYTVTMHLYPEECMCAELTDESTFAMTHIYVEEGVPRIGPRNITVQGVTKETADISWEEIPENDCLGFLVGYMVHYTDLLRNTTQYVTVSSSSATRYHLTGLTGGRKYELKITGMTKKGEGVPSISHIFQTSNYDNAEFQIVLIFSCIGAMLVVLLVVIAFVYTVHRTKKLYFQEVPNPKNSDIMKINELIKEKTSKCELLTPQEEPTGDDDHLEVIETLLSSRTLNTNINEKIISHVQETKQGSVKASPQRTELNDTSQAERIEPHNYLSTMAALNAVNCQNSFQNTIYMANNTEDVLEEL